MEKGAGGRYTALLGDMLELGEDSPSFHEAVGQYAAEHGLQRLFAYGTYGDDLARGAGLGGMPEEAIYVQKDKNDPAAMAEILKEVLIENDILLVKASRGVAAEKVLACLLGDDRR
jgi:UDP-N-acetylmuramoyl-tripeptide--D-alanyl-D-alanine ligase